MSDNLNEIELSESFDRFMVQKTTYIEGKIFADFIKKFLTKYFGFGIM